MLHFDKLIPTVYSISHGENVDLGVAGNMFMQCVQEGKAIYKGSDGPAGFAPDYLALYDASRNTDDGPSLNAEFNAFINKRNAHFKALCALWVNRESQAMIDLMTADTGDYGIGEFPNTLEEAEAQNAKSWAEDAPEGV